MKLRNTNHNRLCVCELSKSRVEFSISNMNWIRYDWNWRQANAVTQTLSVISPRTSIQAQIIIKSRWHNQYICSWTGLNSEFCTITTAKSSSCRRHTLIYKCTSYTARRVHASWGHNKPINCACGQLHCTRTGLLHTFPSVVWRICCYMCVCVCVYVSMWQFLMLSHIRSGVFVTTGTCFYVISFMIFRSVAAYSPNLIRPIPSWPLTIQFMWGFWWCPQLVLVISTHFTSSAWWD